jgi:hypothetical protein
VHSQNKDVLHFFEKDSTVAEQFITDLTAQHKLNLKELKGKENKELKEYYEERFEYMNYLTESENVIFDQKIYPNLNRVLEDIKKANPRYELSKVNRVLVGSSLAPNAVCYGNEVLVVYLGLLNLCENESQIAFLIAHELSHQLLDHVDNSLKAKIAHGKSLEILLKNKEYEKANDYEQNSMYNSYKNDFTFKVKEESRKSESEADSLGYVLLENTGYNKNEAIRLLRILETSDQEKYKIALPLDSLFSGTNKEFNADWLKTKEGLNVKQEFDKELIDSLKTHPDCDFRIAKLIEDFSISAEDTVSTLDEVGYLNTIDFDVIISDLTAKRYARALKNALLQKQLNPANKELNKIIAICIGNIYLATKDHTIFDFVPKPADRFNYNYHQILLLIENIRLSELGDLFEAYYRDNEIAILQSNKDEHSHYLAYLKAAISQTGEEEKLKEEYQSKFPKGNYF